MKISIVCLNLSWQSGGPRLVFSLARAAKAMGHTVTIYAPAFSREYYQELWEGLDIRVVPPPQPLRWSGIPKISSLYFGKQLGGPAAECCHSRARGSD